MNDKDIQQAVLRELEWEPQVKSTEIGVAVKDGIVTLAGSVDSYTKRYDAERAAKRVHGVKAVVNDLEVHLPSSSERTDEAIARAALRALESHITVPRDRIKVTVRDGWITGRPIQISRHRKRGGPLAWDDRHTEAGDQCKRIIPTIATFSGRH